MALQIGSVLSEAGHRIASRTGAILLGTLIALLLAFQVLLNTAMAAALANTGMSEVATTLPLVLDIPLSAAIGGVLVGFLLSIYHSIVSLRTFVAGDRDRFDPRKLTRNLPLALLNLAVGGFVYGVLVAVGTALLVVPGIFAYVALIFMAPYIVVDDRNFVAALRGSYRLTAGDRLPLFGLLVIVIAGSTIVGGITGFVGGLTLSQTGAQLLTVVVQAPVTLFVTAVLAAAFRQLRDEDRGTPPTATDATTSAAL